MEGPKFSKLLKWAPVLKTLELRALEGTTSGRLPLLSDEIKRTRPLSRLETLVLEHTVGDSSALNGLVQFCRFTLEKMTIVGLPQTHRFLACLKLKQLKLIGRGSHYELVSAVVVFSSGNGRKHANAELSGIVGKRLSCRRAPIPRQLLPRCWQQRCEQPRFDAQPGFAGTWPLGTICGEERCLAHSDDTLLYGEAEDARHPHAR